MGRWVWLAICDENSHGYRYLDWIWKLTVTYFCISALIAIIIRQQQINIIFLLGGLVAIFIPIIHTIEGGFSDAFLRLLFMVS